MKENREKHYTIAIMTGDTQSDYSEEMMQGFYIAAKEENVNLILLMGPQIPTYCTDIVTDSSSGNYRYQFNSIYQYAHFIKPDAAIITYGSLSAFNSEHSKENFLKQFSDIPCIMTEDYSDDKNVPCLISDNYGGMKSCMEHLIKDHGYRKIAFLAGPKGNHDSEERLRAYRDTMKENGLEVTDSMIVHGDYTDRVDERVNYLLDCNPGLEAIACANDGMAKSCYRVCNMRNLIVGRDIAITGYDDIKSSSTLNPPMTTVSQSTFLTSYTALKKAVAICRGEKVGSGTVPTMLKKRCSCGCSPMKILTPRYIPQEEMCDFIQEAVGTMAPYLFSSVYYDKDYKKLAEALSEYFCYIYKTIFKGEGEAFTMEHLLESLKKMVEYPYVSSDALLDNLLQLLQILAANTFDSDSQRLMSGIMSSTQQFVHSFNIGKLEREIYLSNRKSWFVPMFTRDLAGEAYINKPQEIFYGVMTELKKMAIYSAYFLLFDKTLNHEPGRWLELPEEIKLIAYYNDHNMKFFGRKEQPVITRESGFMNLIDGKEPVNLIPVILFSGRAQYGIMLCEVDHTDISFLQICSVQMGTLLHFIELNLLEQQVQKELEKSVRVIEDQNSILSFLSQYDELTKLMNRRGFIEKALTLHAESTGKKAYLIFGDLDHLKEINDVYGHAEGDFAIREIAERFRTILPSDAVIGRIGGDEYAAFTVTDEPDFIPRIKNNFVATAKEFNENSDKPYYIEASVGIYECICSPEEEFTEMLKKSDKLLYQAKASRRKTVKKEAL